MHLFSTPRNCSPHQNLQAYHHTSRLSLHPKCLVHNQALHNSHNHARGLIYFERDILAHNVNILNIHALEYTGYVAHICDMKSYFDENLKLIDDRNLEALFPKGSPIYTKIRDDNPTRYAAA